MPREHYPVLWIDQDAVRTLPAEIDITNAGQVREDLLSVLNQGAVLLIADLSKTTFRDSAGVRALVRSFRRAEASGSRMHLVIAASPVQRVLALTGVNRLLDIFPNVARSTRGEQVKRLWSGPSPGLTALAAPVLRGQRRDKGSRGWCR